MTMEADQAPETPAQAPAKVWGKTDIIHFLSDLRGYRSYLELATSMTGNEFAKIDQSRFATCHRLMYQCPDDFDDGLRIDFRAAGPDTADCVADIKARGLSYDIILVDSYHEYALSYRDTEDALGLLAPGGTIIVHDCLPPLGDDTIVCPTRVPGAWCGVSFMAYVDFVTRTAGVDYVTIDTDYGCGIIRRSTGAQDRDARPAILAAWRDCGTDQNAALRLVHEHKNALLRVISVEDFVSAEKKRWEEP